MLSLTDTGNTAMLEVTGGGVFGSQTVLQRIFKGCVGRPGGLV